MTRTTSLAIAGLLVLADSAAVVANPAAGASTPNGATTDGGTSEAAPS